MTIHDPAGRLTTVVLQIVKLHLNEDSLRTQIAKYLRDELDDITRQVRSETRLSDN